MHGRTPDKNGATHSIVELLIAFCLTLNPFGVEFGVSVDLHGWI
jgi:hypothetical protein